MSILFYAINQTVIQTDYLCVCFFKLKESTTLLGLNNGNKDIHIKNNIQIQTLKRLELVLSYLHLLYFN